MTFTKDDTYRLINGTLENGITYVGSYLEKTIPYPTMITDCKGIIHYPYASENSKFIEDVVMLIPNHSLEEYHYSKTKKYLYYPIPYNNTTAYIIVTNLPTSEIPSTIATLKKTELAVKCYFCKLIQGNDNAVHLEQKIYEYLTEKNKMNINDLISISNYQVDFHSKYCIDVMKIDGVMNSNQQNEIIAYLRNYLKKISPDTFFIRCSKEKNALYIFPEENRKIEINSLKTTLEEKFKINLSFGRSNPHSFRKLRRSFNEARIALTYPRIIGSKNKVQSFSELGIFTTLFSQEFDVVKSFCQKTIEPLYDYDLEHETNLVQTVTELVNSNYHLKETAKQLYVHINTLYYRIHKIEELLNVDLSEAMTRTNLFTAVKSWFLLYESGIWDWPPNMSQMMQNAY